MEAETHKVTVTMVDCDTTVSVSGDAPTATEVVALVAKAMYALGYLPETVERCFHEYVSL